MTTTERVSLREWRRLQPGDPGADALVGRGLATDAERQLAERLTASSTLEVLEMRDGLHVAARSWIGRVELGGVTITVEPKLGTRPLMALFRYSYGLEHAVRFDEVQYAETGAGLVDWLVAQLYLECRDLYERGLARAYVHRREVLPTPRGRIDFGALARRGGIRSAELPCEYHPRSTDHLLNQVVAAGLTLASSMASDPRLRRDVARLASLGASVANPCVLGMHTLDRAERQINRLVESYASILRMIRMLYCGRLLDLGDAHGVVSLPGFLFDMNAMWERLLARFLSENLPNATMETQHGLRSMMRYVPGHNPRGSKAPTPRPDYAIRRNGRVVALLDAKYRDLWARSLPREMLYQLGMYAISQPRGATASILYPADDPGARMSRIEIRDPVSGTAAAFIELRPVDLHELASALEERGANGRCRRAEIAERLVWGPVARPARVWAGIW